jgi:DNA-binding response OmpR family regulator
MRLIVVEDKIPLNNSLSKILKTKGYTVDQAFDGAEALEMIDDGYHNLVILDLTLPKIDGLEVIKRLRRERANILILVLTARGQTPQIVDGLQIGADDYLAKPFEIEELLARVQVLLRRQHGQKTAQLQVADLQLDTVTGQVERAGKKIHLTKTEYRLLHYLMNKHHWIVTKDELLTHVWQNETEVYDRVVDTYICFLRRKIDKAFSPLPPLVHTVKTRGYRLGLAEEP